MHPPLTLHQDQLRQKNFVEFLEKMGVELTGIETKGVNDIYYFRAQNNEQAQRSFKQIGDAIQFSNISEKPLTLEDFIEPILSQEVNEQIRAVCLAVFKLMCSWGLHYVFDEKTGKIKIRFPEPSTAYTPMFKQLQSCLLQVVDEQLSFDLQAYLSLYEDDYLMLCNQQTSEIHLFLKSDKLENRIFYITQPNETDSDLLDVTPYFCVPRSATPPNYCFILDASSSMEGSMEEMRNSAIKLANLLFEFQPDAQLNVVIFSKSMRILGNQRKYRKSDLNTLINQLEKLQVEGDATCLYEATNKEIEAFINLPEQHHNTLLFTDGQDTTDTNYWSAKIEQHLKLDENHTLCARNKFFIVSFRQKQGVLMQNVATFFQSLPIINTATPDFVEALADNQRLQEWAASRDLFSTRISVKQQGEKIHRTYSQSFNLSGQFVPLTKETCAYDSSLKVVVNDSHGKVLVTDKHHFPAPQSPEQQSEQTPPKLMQRSPSARQLSQQFWGFNLNENDSGSTSTTERRNSF